MFLNSVCSTVKLNAYVKKCYTYNVIIYSYCRYSVEGVFCQMFIRVHEKILFSVNSVFGRYGRYGGK